MKYLHQLLTVLFTLFAISTALAQQGQDFDAGRMNRDINIMENILAEIFKVETIDHNRNVVVASGVLKKGGGIRGTYLPDYGVIFMIPDVRSNFFLYNHDKSYAFAYSSGNTEDSNISEEAVINRIEEFLRDYGSTIGQLDSDEKIMVIYGVNRSSQNFGNVALFSKNSAEVEEKTRIPTISVVAEKSNLEAYRSGNINEDRFRERLSIARVEDDNQRQLDMEVLANIFETALKDQDDKESFRIRGSVDFLKLDNFGALFFLDVSYSKSFAVISVQFAKELESARRNGQINLRELADSAEDSTKKAQPWKNQINAFEKFTDQLREYIVDYGRTLKSLQPDHFVMVSVNISSSLDEIPERIDVQIKKSDLEALDRGRINRDQAIERVSVREY